jgi:pyrroloquinoline quinone biosynthesis protein B
MTERLMRIVILGAAAGGGVPQWNCNCDVCRAARGPRPELQATQASIAVSVDDEHWFLVNASPDIRQQLIATPALHPKTGVQRHSPIAGVILTNAEVDAVAGLLSMREGWPFRVYAHPKVLSVLKSNSIFDVLDEKRVRREPIELGKSFETWLPDGAPSGLEVLPFAVPGKPAWYLESGLSEQKSEVDGDTLGLRIADKASGKYFYFIAACAALTPDLKRRLHGAPLLLFDGTLWNDDELIAAGLGAKTGQRMGHMSMSGDDGAIAAFANLEIARKVFLHINNSNPVLLPESMERAAAERAGWQIPADGTEIEI